MTFTAKQQKLIDRIRAHKVIGRGSCSVIDECYTDTELIEDFDTLKEALEYHKEYDAKMEAFAPENTKGWLW